MEITQNSGPKVPGVVEVNEILLNEVYGYVLPYFQGLIKIRKMKIK